MHQLFHPVLCIVLYGGGDGGGKVLQCGGLALRPFSLLVSVCWSSIKHHQPGVLCPQHMLLRGMEAQMAINKL